MEQQYQQLIRAFSIAKWFKRAAIAIGLWLVFYPEPFDVALWVAILFPLLVIAVMRFVRVFAAMETPNSGSPYRPMLINMLLPGIALWVRGTQYDILDWQRQWFIIAAIVLVLFIVVVFRNSYFRQQSVGVLTGRFALLLVPLLLYANGVTAMLNCYYDKTEATIYKAAVLETHSELFKKRQRYYIQVGNWGMKTEPETIEVKEEFFKTKAAGDSVDIRYKPGLLGIGWYRLRQF